MANTILIKSLTTAVTVPHATNGLKIAELGVNTYDGRVYLGTKLGASGSAGGESTAATLVGAPVLDEDDLNSDSATKLATQQSIKAYVDSTSGGGDITGVTAGDGLSGGGSSGGVTVTLDLNELGTETSIAQADFIAMVDATDSGSEKITFSNLEDAVFGNVSGGATVAAGGALTIANNSITNAMMADDSVDSADIASGAIDAAHMSANSVDSAAYVDGSIDAAHMSANSIDSASYVDASIDLAHMSANSVDSPQYVDGSIDTAHIANDQITAALIADNAIDSDMYVDGSIDNAHIADDAIDSEHYVNGSVDNAHLANDGITISTTDTSLGGTITFPTMSNVDMGGDFVIGNQSNDTCTITGHLTVAGTTTTTQTIAVGTADTIIFEGATADDFETTLTVVDPTADRTITLPNVTGTVVTTGDTATVTATMLAANSVDSSELVNGSVDLSHMSDNSVDSDQYVDGSIDAAHLAADIITSSYLADDSVNSEHYVDASIDLAHMSANSVDSNQYVDASIDTAHIANDQITAALMADNSIDSDMYVDASIDLAHMSANSVDSNQYVDGSVDNVHLANSTMTIAGASTALGATISAATIASAIDSETMTLTNTTMNGGTYATS